MLAPWKESYNKPRQHIKKQRHYFADKGSNCQAIVFPVVMYGCESWTIKKAEHRRIDVFELWYWRRLLKVPWTVRRSNQWILKEIWIFIGRTHAKAETPVLCHLMWRADFLEKALMLWKIKDRRRRGWQRMRWLDGIINTTEMSLNKWEIVKDTEACLAAVHRFTKCWTGLRKWTTKR